jgi:hypothetical protein
MATPNADFGNALGRVASRHVRRSFRIGSASRWRRRFRWASWATRFARSVGSSDGGNSGGRSRSIA